jgi:pimeloyl-ACP methyl ester carboxylesterase
VRRRLIALASVVLLAAGLVTACGDDDATDSAADKPVDVYDVASPLPAGKPGDVLAAEKLDPVTGIDGRVWRIQYLSTSAKGKPVAVTGVVAIPAGTSPAGGWPVVSYAHGTAGLADICAPSKDVAKNLAVIIGPMVAKGWIVAASDYEGLGTPGRHPYIAGDSEAHGVLDIARAVQDVQQSHAGKQVLLWGHSQGGHAVVFANEVAKTYAPDLDVVGTAAIAPASELPLIAGVLGDSPARGYLVLAALGLNAAYPEADPAIVLGPKAIAADKVVDTGCTSEVLAAYVDMPKADIILADPGSVEPWKSLMLANDPGHRVGESPLFIVHGDADKTIPVIASQLLLARLCGLQQPAKRTVYPGAGHSDVAVAAFDDLAAFATDRFAGKPFVNAC